MKIEPALGAPRMDSEALSIEVAPLADVKALVWRRLAFWGPILCLTALGTACGAVATAEAPSLLRWPLLGLLAINLSYFALTGMPALIGFALHVSGRKLRVSAAPGGTSRTALLMPIHCEEPRSVFAAVEVMARGLAEAGVRGVDLFVLSDTQDGTIAAAEQVGFELMVGRIGSALGVDGPGLRYRRRPSNAGRKVGNLAEFCDTRGGDYDYMLVLDADSLMGAGTIERLIGLMDANPRTGIIQTVPYPVGRETLFGRLQQFAARLYTPLLVEGLTFWQGGDGNYWGHNAIVRIAPFRVHCGLPVLPGREPWGGEILCHDVVEAGLMRGAGWDCWVLPEVVESYEAVPANLVDFIARERRWCQGNLQHLGVVGRPGFRPVGRFHLAYGITHYLAAPAALLFLLLATVDAVWGGGFAGALFSGTWGLGLVSIGAVLLYGGKVLTLLATLADGAEARRYGGRWALLGGAVLEQLAAFAVSALLMVAYTRYVLDLLCGRTVRWESQPRDDRGVSWREAWLRMRLPALVGLAWLATLPWLPVDVRGWTLPLLVGLLAVLPLTVLSSRTSLGSLAQRFGLLLTPEEQVPPPVVRAYRRAFSGKQSVPPRPVPAVKLQLVRESEGA